MAYTTALRDHVWAITSDGTAGGVTLGAGLSSQQERIKTIRWIPAAGTDMVTVESFKEDGTSIGVQWESVGGSSTAVQESRLDLRLCRGFKVVMTTGGKLYLYEALDAGLK